MNRAAPYVEVTLKMAGEVLGRLCNSGGWSYAALWRIDCRGSRLFVLEESYLEEQSGTYFGKMINHVNGIEQGIIGEVAISGRCRWINFGTDSIINSDMFQCNTGWHDQILAGIKTVALIPLPSFGVIQFGSTQKICENSDFIAQAQNSLWQLQIKQHGYVHADSNFSHPQATFSSAVPSLYSSTFKNNTSSHDGFCKQRLDNCLSSRYSMPLSTSCAISHKGNLFYGAPCSSGSSSSYQLMNQEAALSKTQISPKYHLRAKEINSFSYPDHGLFPGVAIPGVFNMIPTTLHSSFSDFDTFHLRSENSMLSHSKGGSTAMADNGSFSSSRCPPLTQAFPEFLLTSPQDRNLESANHHILDNSMNNQIHSADKSRNWIESTTDSHNDLFDHMELDPNPMILRQECWNDVLLPDMGTSDCLSAFAIDSIPGSNKEFFTDSSSLEQLLDAVVTGDANLSCSCNSAGSQDSRNHISTTTELSNVQMEPAFVPTRAISLAELDLEKMMQGSSKEGHTLWIDDSCCINADGSTLDPTKQDEESGKVIKKRARPGESTRPKPKDRQHIQDRVKELREIVPNSAKCSIDALLDRTIKHMLFLQSVTKYADKVNHVDEPELIGEESGVVLKDNTNGGVDGATWAYEVAGQTMVCPILIEDAHPSGQMVVEMLCEERGFFLEIADVVRGFGLTILKGVMEIRERKLWSRFLVEANRDVTRMDIFLSLIQLLHRASSFREVESHADALAGGITSPAAYRQQYFAPVPIGHGGGLM